MSNHPISFKDIESAAEALSGVAIKTTCEFSRSASEYLGTDAFLKFENQQRTGSFKIRGAYNKISKLDDEQKARGISACSAGNHAQGVAYSAREVGSTAHIVMPEIAPLSKIEATKNYGAKIHLHGEVFDEAYEYCQNLTKENNFEFVHPYEDADVIAGQGTIGLELYEQVKDLTSVVIGVGGGGLASGTALALKTLNPKIKIYGAVAEAAPGMFNLYHGDDKPFTCRPTIADGIAIKKPSKMIYENYLSKYVDDIITVNDNEMAEAMVFLIERAKAVVEGAGATGLAAARKARDKWDLGKKTAVILCGGNIDLNLIATVVEKGLSSTGRMTRIEVAVEDMPGNLARLTQLIADEKANVVHVNHNRIGSKLGLRETSIEFVLSTKDKEHVARLIKCFEKAGARVLRASF